ncbi:uncharacterized protein LOC128861034 isoform X1 [Anastrepha ludens]|uniref:uncharacterized protein LOC128861034 isoform X1 n=1 Tax=Anastrepha ludens TaxID=28586 RepID=UPI0023B01871|nr:uncharacterized protein LOC128861034 isoform X1 [Anastrepha ludens]XP_053954883.1 uncharacterized protein LOC128861034 isoform X1 [Anastrepha ludens]
MHTNVPVLKVFDVVPAGGSRGRRKKRVGNLFPLILRPQILRRELMPCRDRRRIPNARKYTDLAETCGSAHLGANIFPEYLAGSLKIQGCPYLTTATLYLLTETSDRLMTYRVGSISPSKFLPWKSTRHASAQIVEIYIQQKKSIVKTQRAYKKLNNVKSAPSKNTIKHLYERFSTGDALSNPRRPNQNRSRRSDENIALVRGSVETSPLFSAVGHCKQNCRIYATENPDEIQEVPLYDEKVTVWCGVSAKTIIGLFFFENEDGQAVTVNQERYRDMITTFVMPIIRRKRMRQFWFQQDGAPPHTARTTIDFLKKLFPRRLMSKNGDFDWPPRCPI